MRRGLRGAGAGREHGRRAIPPHTKEMDMKWQTPQAQDFRFGFEITMYVAAR